MGKPMRIAFLCKRQYMRKDVITDRYGRLYELPRQLAAQGHMVLGVCLSYRKRDEGSLISEPNIGWHSQNLGLSVVPGLFRYRRTLDRLFKQFKPDILVGASDAPHVALTAYLARRYQIPFVIDLYDNFESFGLSRLPGLPYLYHRAIRAAAGITCVSRPLSQHIQSHYQPVGPVITLESVVNTDIFSPLPQNACREKLGLPLDGKLIGVVGALDEERGMPAVYQAFQALRATDKRVHLVLAGTPSKSCPIPKNEAVHFLGTLDHSLMPVFYNALDIAVIPMRDTPFGRYAFPQKLYEIIACRVPLIAASVGALQEVLADYPECLYTTDSAEDLASQMASQLNHPTVPKLNVMTWSEVALRIEALLNDAVNSSSLIR